MTGQAADVGLSRFDADLQPYLRELEARGLSCSLDVDPWPRAARALVVVAASQRLGAVKEFLEPRWKNIINCGAHVIFAVAPEDVKAYEAWKESDLKLAFSNSRALEQSFFTVSVADPRLVANFVANLSKQRVPRIPFNHTPNTLPGDDVGLLSRAFNDCVSIKAQNLTPGRTARVYRIDAERSAGHWLLPFLAKVGPRAKIVEEFDSFVENVRDLVPFSARPNLAPDRCLLGASEGILVGHFIEESEPLIDAILRGAPQSLLHSVFDDVLRGWWRRGELAREYKDRPVTTELDHWFDPIEVDRRDALQKHHKRTSGASACEPPVLAKLLANRAPSRHLRSLIHGDLHASNIHVRGNEIFLIDFGSVREGPILADPAFLEASIVLDAGIAAAVAEDKGALGSMSAWKDALDNGLYCPGWDSHRHVPQPSASANTLARRLCAAVHVVRMHALRAELADGDYRAVLAAAYLRIACFDNSDPKQRSAIVTELYALACRLAK